MDVQGKCAVVTGGGSGIGRAIALAFAGAGCSVVVADVDESAAGETTSAIGEMGGKASPMKCDVTDLDSVEALADAAFAAHGGVDIVVNNAGVSGGAALLESDALDLRWGLRRERRRRLERVQGFRPPLRRA